MPVSWFKGLSGRATRAGRAARHGTRSAVEPISFDRESITQMRTASFLEHPARLPAPAAVGPNRSTHGQSRPHVPHPDTTYLQSDAVRISLQGSLSILGQGNGRASRRALRGRPGRSLFSLKWGNSAAVSEILRKRRGAMYLGSRLRHGARLERQPCGRAPVVREAQNENRAEPRRVAASGGGRRADGIARRVGGIDRRSCAAFIHRRESDFLALV